MHFLESLDYRIEKIILLLENYYKIIEFYVISKIFENLSPEVFFL